MLVLLITNFLARQEENVEIHLYKEANEVFED